MGNDYIDSGNGWHVYPERGNDYIQGTSNAFVHLERFGGHDTILSCSPILVFENNICRINKNTGKINNIEITKNDNGYLIEYGYDGNASVLMKNVNKLRFMIGNNFFTTEDDISYDTERLLQSAYDESDIKYWKIGSNTDDNISISGDISHPSRFDGIMTFDGKDIISCPNYPITLYGGKGSDTYNLYTWPAEKITNSPVIINDYTGSNDTINIALEKSAINIYRNIDKDGNYVDKNLYIYLDTYGATKYVEIDNYFTGYGKIENINSQAFGKVYSFDNFSFDNIQSDVASWLKSDSRAYADVNAVMSSGNEADINALMAYFADNTTWTQGQL